MSTAWDHLPNAKHIDRVLAKLEENPDAWAGKWDAKWEAAWNDTKRDAWDDAKRDAWDDAWAAAKRSATSRAANINAGTDVCGLTCGAILALMVYDNCAYLLDEKPEDVKMLALLGNNAAILIYPTCLALQKETTH